MLALFAQARAGAGGGGAGGADMAALMGVMIFYFGIIALAILVQVFFLLSMSRCLKEVSSRNRKMEPGQVWLSLIPIFGFIWIIIMILRVADSLRDEFDDRGLRGDGDYGKTLGLVYIISAFICGPVSLVCFIMYWVKINGYTKQLRERGGDRDDDDYDDRPRRRRRDDDDDDYEDDDRPARRKR